MQRYFSYIKSVLIESGAVKRQNDHKVLPSALLPHTDISSRSLSLQKDGTTPKVMQIQQDHIDKKTYEIALLKTSWTCSDC